MSDAYKCDRCGSIELGTPQVRVSNEKAIDFLVPDGSTHKTGFGGDLCSECEASLCEWWEGASDA